MGWHDREWARHTNEERRHLYGGLPSSPFHVALWSAVVAGVLVTGGYFVRSTGHGSGAPVVGPAAPVVYSGVTGDGGKLACTAEGANVNLRIWICTEWTIVQPGQTTRAAIDPGGPCGVRHVDQRSGAWVCDSVSPPAPSSLPPPPPVSPAARDRLS